VRLCAELSQQRSSLCSRQTAHYFSRSFGAHTHTVSVSQSNLFLTHAPLAHEFTQSPPSPTGLRTTGTHNGARGAAGRDR
jgi:hypothetical protein